MSSWYERWKIKIIHEKCTYLTLKQGIVPPTC